jgi:hypothetical protein
MLNLWSLGIVGRGYKLLFTIPSANLLTLMPTNFFKRLGQICLAIWEF